MPLSAAAGLPALLKQLRSGGYLASRSKLAGKREIYCPMYESRALSTEQYPVMDLHRGAHTTAVTPWTAATGT